jgi:folate-binding protein YgfZ
VGVFGLEALQVVSGVLGLSREVLHKPERFHCSVAVWRDREITVAATTELAVPGFDLFVPADSANALVDQLVASGASHVGLAAWEIARIENGVPEWGIDMDDNTLAQEAELERMHAISFTKGCYTGQETVARVHFRGHVNRHLRQLRFAGVAVPPPGAQVFGDGDRNLGDVRSSAYSPKQGGVAIAMLRHEAVVGSAVSVRWDDMECQAGVYELPLESA